MITVLDIVLLVVIAAAAIRCFFRGFVAEVMSTAAVLVGILGAVMLSEAGALLIDEHVAYSRWNEVIAFLVIFLAIYLVVRLIEGILRGLLERIRLDRLDRALGFFLGIAEGIIAVMVIVYLLKVQPVFDLDQTLANSFVARIALDIIPLASPELGRELEAGNV